MIMSVLRALIMFFVGLIPALAILLMASYYAVYEMTWIWLLWIGGGVLGTLGIIGFMTGADHRPSSFVGHLTAIAMVVGLFAALPLVTYPFFLFNPLLLLIWGPVVLATLYLYRYVRAMAHKFYIQR